MKWNSNGGTVKVEQGSGTVMLEQSWWNSEVEQSSGTVRVKQGSGTLMVEQSGWNTEVEQ